MFTGFDAAGICALGEAPEDRVALVGTATVVLDWEVRIYAATHEFITRPTDSPADVAFKGTLQKAFRIDRSIIGVSRIGEEVTIGLGEVTLSNLEGYYDFLAQDSTPLGQRIEIKMGDRRRPYTEWKTILSGYMVSQTIDRDAITFRLRDAGHRLDVPASPNIYAGTGGTEGGDDLKGKRKPRGFGYVENATPPLVVPASLAYQLNDGRIDAVTAVNVRGVSQVFSADYATVALMNAASLSVGQYATCLEEGWVRIAVAGGSEVGQVTCDFQGDKAGALGGTFVYTAGSIVRRLLTSASGILDPDDLVVSTFTALETAQPAEIGYFIPSGDEQTLRQAVGRIMASIGGWCGARRSGKFEARRFNVPAGAVAGVYDKKNIVDVAHADVPDDLSPPPWRLRVGWGRNWTVQKTDIAGSVTDARRAYLAEPVRFASDEDEATRIDFPPGAELVVEDAFFREEADAQAEATRRLALFGEPRELFTVKLAERLFVHELGENVRIAFPRFGLDSGRQAVIVKLIEDDADGVEMTVFT